MTLRRDGWSPQQAARIAGAAYLITDATAIFSEFFVRSTLIVSGDAARTASNIVAHAQLFRGGIVSDLLTWAGVVILNLALYELLAPVHRSLARILFPATVAAVPALPAVAMASLAVIFLPILSFEILLGLWLLVKGVRIPERA